MIVTELLPETFETSRQPKCFVYYWSHDEDVTKDEIREHAALLIDDHDLAGPVEFIDNEPADLFRARLNAATLLTEIQDGDYVVISPTSVPILLDWYVLINRLMRADVHVQVVDPVFKGTYEMCDQHEMLTGFEDRILDLLSAERFHEGRATCRSSRAPAM